MAGLYASIAGLIVGGALTSSQTMVIATTSAAAITSQTAIAGSRGDPTVIVATFTVLCGLAMLTLVAVGFTRLMRFVSASVMAGFLFGIGVTLIASQVADAAGVVAVGDSVLARFVDTLRQFREFNGVAILVSASAVVIAAAGARLGIRGVAPLAALVLPGVAVWTAELDVDTVADVVDLRLGLPPVVLPDLALITPSFVGAAFAVAVVVLVQAAGVSASNPAPDGRLDLVRDLRAQGAANIAAGVIAGIPIGASNGQTALNVLAGGRTRWAVILSGVWMLVFVSMLGPVLGFVPIPALAGLLILAGIESLRPRRLNRSWRTSTSSAAAAGVTVLATLTLPVPLAVLTGVVLSLILVGISSASLVRVVGLERTHDSTWRRIPTPRHAERGSITIVDVEGSVAFTSVEHLFRRLPQPPESADDAVEWQGAVIIRMKGHLRTNVTFVLALQRYADELGRSGIELVLAGLTDQATAQLRRAGVSGRVRIVPESAELGGALEVAYREAAACLGDLDPDR